LSTCYKSQIIHRYFGNGNKFGLNIEYITEDFPLGTGGAIKNAEKFFDETFLVFNADIITDVDFKKLVEYHQNMRADVTIVATWVEDPSAYGAIEYNEENYITAFKEKPSPGETSSRYINAGVYVFEPWVLAEIPSGRVVSVEREVFPALIRKGYKVAIYKNDHYWMDIGTPEKYMQVHRDILNGRCKLGGLMFTGSQNYIGANSKIHSRAKIIKPVYIGNNVEICAGAVIGPNSVIGNGVWVGQDSRIVGSIVWENVLIERDSQVVDTIHCIR